MNSAKQRVVFVFSHGGLSRVWAEARELLASEGIEVTVANQMTPLDWEVFCGDTLGEADAAYLELSRHFPTFDALVAAADGLGAVVPGGMETVAAFPDHDRAAAERLAAYLQGATPEDLANATRMLLWLAGRLETEPDDPSQPLLCGIYAPDAGSVFASFEDYQSSQSARDPKFADRPVVAIVFARRSWLEGDMALADAAADALTTEGFAPLAVFCDWQLAGRLGQDADHPLEAILRASGERLCSIWNALFWHSTSGVEDGGPFQRFDVPVVQLVRDYDHAVEEWLAGSEGLSAMSICYNFTQPEMLGCIEPSVVACTTKEPNALGTGMVSRAAPVPERLGHLAQRMRRWHVLQTAAPADKRLAIMLHNSPCKSVEGTVAEAAGLDAAESTVRLLRRLRNEGWRVDDIPADGAALLTMILERKALQEFRWTNVEEIVAKGGVLARIDQASYEADFERLLPATREEVNEAWGPFPGEAMVHDADGGNPVLLITGLRFGNVTVMVEPKRGCYGPRCDGEVCRILHEPDIAPSHHWLATYWWVQREADAVVQMGAESPLEFLPGKRAGLSDRCYPEISLGTLPSIYPYIMNSTAEGLLAKRRGRAVIVDHLSPPVRRGQELSEQWAGIEELHRQFMAAREAGEAGRLAAITRELRPAMETMNLLPPNAGDEQFRRRLDELPRRLEKLRGRLVETGSHVLGRMPSPEDRDCYMAEADGNGRHGIDVQELSAALERTTDEMDRVVAALNGRFVPAGPSGHLSRGKVDALPTGRNIYGIDVNTIPTAAACDVGAQMGRLVLQKHLREEGRLPESIGVTVWSSDAFLRDGELTGQVLWLLGCRPVWGRGGRVSGIEVLPLDELTMLDSAGQRIQRPRVDVVVQMSAVTRDTLPNLYGLLDDAVTQVAALDESPERNLVRKHVAERLDALREKMQDTDEAILRRLATFRVFSAKPGSYGEGVGLAVDASAWETDKDLAETFVNWCGYAYGRDTSGEGTAAGDAEVTMREFAHLMGGIDVAYQKAVGPEYDALSISCYAGFQGGMAATKRAVGGTSAKLYWGDSVTSDTLDVRDLAEEIDLSMLGKLLNPDWIERQKEEGYRGASAVAGMVNTAFAWSATSHVVSKEQFDAMCRTFIEDEENRRWLGTANVYALEEISRRLLEAAARKLWDADEQSMQALQSAVLEIEGDIEERMGPVQGEFQGGSVDIFTKDSVDKWKPEFTVP